MTQTWQLLIEHVVSDCVCNFLLIMRSAPSSTYCTIKIFSLNHNIITHWNSRLLQCKPEIDWTNTISRLHQYERVHTHLAFTLQHKHQLIIVEFWVCSHLKEKLIRSKQVPEPQISDLGLSGISGMNGYFYAHGDDISRYILMNSIKPHPTWYNLKWKHGLKSYVNDSRRVLFSSQQDHHRKISEAAYKVSTRLGWDHTVGQLGLSRAPGAD